jgi:hypothetical protein
MAQSPCFLLPLSDPSYLLGTLLAVIGSRPPWSQVAHKLISPLHPPHPSPFRNPDPLGFSRAKCALTTVRRHRNTGLQVQNITSSGAFKGIVFRKINDDIFK